MRKIKIKDNQICETCGGSGEVMEMVCYGGDPVEWFDDCPDCDCEGYLTKRQLAENKKYWVKLKKQKRVVKKNDKQRACEYLKQLRS